MYVTRPLSRYLADPSAAVEAPPEGPGSGFLVVVDEAAIERATCCWGLTWDKRVKGLPFPQSRRLALQHSSSPSPAESALEGLECIADILGNCVDTPDGSRGHTPAATDFVVFVPVVGYPLSSRRYYVVQDEGKHRGKVSACSKEEDNTVCCFCTCVNDVKPRPFDSRDVYQQVVVEPSGGRDREFKAEAVATDGIPPHQLRKKGWKVIVASKKYDLADDAQGVDRALRRRLPPSLDDDGNNVVVGKWYVPFLFVRADGERRLKDQARRTMFYEMTLEQSWERIYHRRAAAMGEQINEVAVAAMVRRRTALLGGTHALQEGSPHVDGDGAVWFRPAAVVGAGGEAVCLDAVLWDRMRWEMERGGWVAPATGHNGDREERIERVERRDPGLGHWDKFACYLLLERFVLRRMDRSVALTCEFRHTHTDKIRAKWA